MLELLKNHWDEGLSVLAIIVALVPLVIKHIQVKRRKIYANVVDYNIITNAVVKSYDNSIEFRGTTLLLAVNYFVSNESYFAENYNITAYLKSGSTSKVVITDGTYTIHISDNKSVSFEIPSDYNFNLHKEIISEKDNIRVIPLMLVDTAIDKIDDIERIIFTFKNHRECKKVELNSNDFPTINKMKFLCEFEKDVDIF